MVAKRRRCVTAAIAATAAKRLGPGRVRREAGNTVRCVGVLRAELLGKEQVVGDQDPVEAGLLDELRDLDQLVDLGERNGLPELHFVFLFGRTSAGSTASGLGDGGVDAVAFLRAVGVRRVADAVERDPAGRARRRDPVEAPLAAAGLLDAGAVVGVADVRAAPVGAVDELRVRRVRDHELRPRRSSVVSATAVSWKPQRLRSSSGWRSSTVSV